MKANSLILYKKYHADRDDERLDMFRVLAKQFNPDRVLYPGCFVHMTPSFVFPEVVYVDMDQRAKRFFAAPEVQKHISDHKEYPQEAQVKFHDQDYTKPLPERDESFELLISQYGGFISQHCKRYLKGGGWLLANNSHGDASMAYLDDDYELVGVVNRRGSRFTLSAKKLEDYFIPKKDRPITKEYLTKIQRGIGYRKTAFAYIFIKNNH